MMATHNKKGRPTAAFHIPLEVLAQSGGDRFWLSPPAPAEQAEAAETSGEQGKGRRNGSCRRRVQCKLEIVVTADERQPGRR